MRNWGQSDRGNMIYQPHIDGLRAIAVLAVVVFHAFPELLPGGFVGVDVFFVISGFLITSIIRTEIEAGRFTLTGFYERRARRLLPASLTVYAAAFAAAAALMPPDAFRMFGRSLTAVALFYSNFWFADKTGYFDAPVHEQPLIHTWSLSIEEQFYLLWAPVLLLLLLRMGTRRLLVLAVIAVVALVGVSEWLARTVPEQAYFVTQARIWELLVGAILALSPTAIRLGPAAREAVAMTGLAAILASAVLLTSGATFPGLAALPACLGTLAVIAACRDGGTRTAALLSVSPLVGIGLVSYSLYLWHWPVLSFATLYLERMPDTVERLALVATAFVLAGLSWRFIEQPFRKSHAASQAPRHAGVRTSRPALAWGLAGVAAVALAGVAVNLGKGWPWRLDDTASRIYAQMLSKNPYRPSCYGTEQAFAHDRKCNFGAPRADGQSFDAAIFGDSNADHFVPALESIMRSRGLSARQVTHSACGPLIGVNIARRSALKRAECLRYQQTVLEFIARNPGLRLVVLSGNWTNYTDALVTNAANPAVAPVSSTGQHPTSRQSGGTTSLRSHLETLIAYFETRGIHVHLISQIPHQDVPVRCVIREVRAGRDGSTCGGPSAGETDRLTQVDRLFETLAAQHANVTATIPSRHLCRNGTCRVAEAATLLYHDSGHLNAYGAARLAPIIALPDRIEAPQGRSVGRQSRLQLSE